MDNIGNIIFEFKRFCRNNKNEFMEIEELANEFMYMNRIYGEDIFNELIKIKID